MCNSKKILAAINELNKIKDRSGNVDEIKFSESIAKEFSKFINDIINNPNISNNDIEFIGEIQEKYKFSNKEEIIKILELIQKIDSEKYMLIAAYFLNGLELGGDIKLNHTS